MPYKVKKAGEDFVVVNSETGKQVPGGNHGDDEDKAKAHLSALYKNVKEAKSVAEYDTALTIKGMFSIGELEAALDVAITNEPINRREGNIEQADLELQHATDFRDAINLLQAGKSLPNELTRNISSSIKSYLTYLKGGPGSGRYPKGSGSLSDDDAPGSHQGVAPSNMSKEQLLERYQHHAQLDKDYGHNAPPDNSKDMAAIEAELRKRKIDYEYPTSSKRKSFSDLKSAIEERVNELSVKSG